MKILMTALLALSLIFAPMAAAQAPPPVHSVSLSWTASVSPSVTHYAVYRSLVSGGPYNYIGYTTGLTYVNSKNADGSPLVAGTTYYFVVVAFTAPDPVTKLTSNSVISNEFAGTIPTTTTAPATNLTGQTQ